MQDHPPNISDQIVLRAIYVITSLGLCFTGLGFIIGPHEWRTTSGYIVLARMAPIDAWAWTFLAIGLFKLALVIGRSQAGEHLRLGSTLGGMVSAGWAIGQIAAAVTTGIMGWGSIPAWSTIAVVQLISAARIWR